MKKLFIYLLPVLALVACRNNEPVVYSPKSIVILYENDVHCAIDGYHEFDYGMPRQLELLPIIGSPVSCTNLYEYVSAASVYAPYVIKQYGNKRIAFVGVFQRNGAGR